MIAPGARFLVALTDTIVVMLSAFIAVILAPLAWAAIPIAMALKLYRFLALVIVAGHRRGHPAYRRNFLLRISGHRPDILKKTVVVRSSGDITQLGLAAI
jgi:hypothetical protein